MQKNDERLGTAPLGKIHLWIDWINVHFIHVASGFAAANVISSGFQLCRHLSCAPGRMIRMEMINDLFAGQFFF